MLAFVERFNIFSGGASLSIHKGPGCANEVQMVGEVDPKFLVEVDCPEILDLVCLVYQNFCVVWRSMKMSL